MDILIDPRTYITPTGFGLCVAGGPGGLEDRPYLWAISQCCVAQVHFRMVDGENTTFCSSCQIELKFPSSISGNSIAMTSQKDLQAWVREFTGLDELDLRVDV